jgi:Integrase core domain
VPPAPSSVPRPPLDRHSTAWSSPPGCRAARAAVTTWKPNCATWGVRQKNGKPNHPQTQGKAGRFQQTLKKWLRAQPAQPATLAELQALPGAFTSTCNGNRPHRSLPHRATPATACAARPKAAPGDRTAGTHDRVRAGRAGTDGKLTLRVGGKLHHIGIGRTHARTRVLMLVSDLHVRVINAATGELLRELTIDPARNYQPTGRLPGPRPAHHARPANAKTPDPDEGSGCPRCLETPHLRARQDSNPRPAANPKIGELAARGL